MNERGCLIEGGEDADPSERIAGCMYVWEAPASPWMRKLL